MSEGPPQLDYSELVDGALSETTTISLGIGPSIVNSEWLQGHADPTKLNSCAK